MRFFIHPASPIGATKQFRIGEPSLLGRIRPTSSGAAVAVSAGQCRQSFGSADTIFHNHWEYLAVRSGKEHWRPLGICPDGFIPSNRLSWTNNLFSLSNTSFVAIPVLISSDSALYQNPPCPSPSSSPPLDSNRGTPSNR